LAEAPWSILRYEQMHGVGAAQKKLHHEYGPATLASKSACHMMLPMVRREEDLTRRYKEDRRLDSLRRRQPEKAGASGAYFGDAVARKMGDLGLSAQPMERFAATKEVMK
jgi:hypothetical protein